jgi:TetR/AcrR family transcriptional regulator, transcriptional repressor for nem operon
MRGRPSSFDQDRVMEKAQQVFWEKGFAGTSLEDLLNAMDMGSGSFYNTFKGGKKELFSKAIQQRREAFQQFKTILMASASPIDNIKDFFRSIATADRHTHMMGCIIANTVVEMTFIDEELEKEAVAILKEVEQMYTWAIRKGQQNGTIKNQSDPELLGRYLISVYNGLNVTRRMHPNNKGLKDLIEIQLSVVS